MRALVTGASEFLGRRLVWQLHAQGHGAVALARDGSERSGLDLPAAEVAIGEVADRSSLVAALADVDVDVVFHVAARSHFGAKNPAGLDRIDVDGSRNVFDVAAEAGVTVVYASSVFAYGPTGPDPQPETYWSEAESTSESERGRRAAHLVAREFQQSGADIRIAAVGTVYGPDDPSPMGRLTRWYMTVPFPVIPLRDAVWSTVHVDDCADGLIRIAEEGTSGNEYVLAAETVTVKEWVETLAAAVDKPAPLAHIPEGIVARASRLVEWGVHAVGGPHELIAEYMAASTRSHAYSGAKARRELGWNPRPLAVGLAQLAGVHRRPLTAPRR